MAVADLFLRSKSKVRATDLWLHQAGADGGAPTDPFDSGTAAAVALFGGAEGLADSQTITPVAAHNATEALTDQGAVMTVAQLGGDSTTTGTTSVIFGPIHTGWANTGPSGRAGENARGTLVHAGAGRAGESVRGKADTGARGRAGEVLVPVGVQTPGAGGKADIGASGRAGGGLRGRADSGIRILNQ